MSTQRRMRVEIPDDSLERNPGEMEVLIWDPLPNVPYWLLIDFNSAAHPFWTLPAGHYFEHTTGEMGFPRRLQEIASRYAAGAIDRAAAEFRIAETLDGWSRATTWVLSESGNPTNSGTLGGA